MFFLLRVSFFHLLQLKEEILHQLVGSVSPLFTTGVLPPSQVVVWDFWLPSTVS